MDEAQAFSSSAHSVAVLFHPSIVPIIDTFRSLDILDDRYDIHVLNEPERELTQFTYPEAAKAIVSDALLLAFALGRQRGQPLSYRPLKSRQGSLDEYSLLTLIGASREPDSELAFEAAAALRIVSLDFMMSLAADLLRQIDRAQLVFETPSVSEFRAIVSDRLFFEDPFEEFRDHSGFKFQN